MISRRPYHGFLIVSLIFSVISAGCISYSFEKAPVPISEPLTITQSGNYRVQNDIFLSDYNAAVVILSPNVTIDGNGRTIVCTEKVKEYCQTNNCTSFGVVINGQKTTHGNVTNVTVKNLNIRGCDSGIIAYYPFGNSSYWIQNVTITDGDYGIQILQGDRNTLLLNSVTGNKRAGISIEGSDFNRLIGNNVSGINQYDYDLEYLHNEFIELIPDPMKKNTDLKNLFFYGKDTTIPFSNPVIINSPGTYKLDRDILFDESRTYVIAIRSSDVIVDGNFHTIKCTDEGSQANAVKISGGGSEHLKNVTVKNLNVSGCKTGVFAFYLRNNSYYKILNNTFSSCESAIMIVNGDRNIILGNTFFDNIYHNIMIWSGSDYNFIENNTVLRNNNYLLNKAQNTISEGDEILPVFSGISAGRIQNTSVPVYAGATIRRPGTYVLQTDLEINTTNPAIWITSPDVVLDGNFHSISCTEYSHIRGRTNSFGSTSDAVRIDGTWIWNGNVTNVTIKNIRITGCEVGISAVYPYGTSNYTIENSIITGCDSGIILHSGDQNTLQNNAVYGNMGSGISSEKSNNNTLTGNYVRNNGPEKNFIDSAHNRGNIVNSPNGSVPSANPFTESQKNLLISNAEELARNPENASAWERHARISGNLGRYNDSIEYYNMALALSPNDSILWRDRGLKLGHVGRYQDEVLSYDKALLFNHNDSSTWNLRGRALANLGQCQEAYESWMKVRSLSPDQFVLYQTCHNPENISATRPVVVIGKG